MPFSRPDLATLIDRISSDINSRLPGADARLRRAVLNILARAEAGATHGLYGHQAWIARQIIVDTAESDYLERWASVWGLSRKAPVAATGSITLAGTDGYTAPAGSVLTRSDGAEFTLDADAAIASGTATASVTASTPGTAGDSAAGTTLTFASPIAGIQAEATVGSGGITGGADTETDDELRTRLVERIQNPPQGGASEDYVTWALAVSGVTRAWCFPQEIGAGTVTVRFVTDDAPGGIIPDAATVQAVQDYIDGQRPVTATVYAVAPVAAPIDFTIKLTPNTQAVQDAVTTELKDLITREASPGGKILLSHINEAISVAAGETDHQLVAPTADVTNTTGQIATMGTITWQ